jgi:predicted PurR-regulated permease PerM
MDSSSSQSWDRLIPWLRVLVIGLVVAGVTYLAWRIRELILMVVLAAVLAYVLKPAVDGLCRQRAFGRSLSRFWATVVVFILAGVGVWLFFRWFGNDLREQIRDLRPALEQQRSRLPRWFNSIQAFYADRVPADVKDAIRHTWGDWQKAIGNVLLGIAKSAWESLGFVIELVLVPVLAFYFLSDLPGLKEAAHFFVPPARRARLNSLLADIDRVFTRFVEGQLVLAAIAWAVVTVGLRALDMRFWLILGLIAGITRAIPVVGPVIGGVPILLATFAFLPWKVALWVLVAFAIMHVLESKLLMPKVLGIHLGLHPVLIIMALLVGYMFFGVLGMFLAAPGLAVAKLLVAHSRSAAEEAALATSTRGVEAVS